MEIKTLSYKTKNRKEELLMDLYMPPHDWRDGRRLPVLIHLHSGEFKSGSRFNRLLEYYCSHFAGKGFAVFSIDYRLTLQTAEVNLPNILKAVTFGIEDLMSATSRICGMAEEYGLDTDKILVSGSGAGAMIALSAEYQLCNRKTIPPVKGLNYAGIISSAGAVITDADHLEWKRKPCPILLLHGTYDQVISFNKFFVPGMLWAGSNYIHDELLKLDAPHWLYEEQGTDHIMAMKPLQRQIHEMETFVEKFVMEGKHSIAHTVWRDETPDKLEDIRDVVPMFLEGWKTPEDIDSIVKDYVEISQTETAGQ